MSSGWGMTKAFGEGARGSRGVWKSFDLASVRVSGEHVLVLSKSVCPSLELIPIVRTTRIRPINT